VTGHSADRDQYPEEGYQYMKDLDNDVVIKSAAENKTTYTKQ
jgi:hypothetical protein